MNEHFIVVFSLDIYPYLKQKAFQFMTYELYRRDPPPPPPPHLSPRASPYRETPLAHDVSCHCCGYSNRYYVMHVKCYYLISFYVFQAISKLNMDNNYSAILQERRNILHLNNLYVLRRGMQVAILLKILTYQPTWYIREVYSGLPERPEIVRLPPPPPPKKNQVQLKKKVYSFFSLRLLQKTSVYQSICYDSGRFLPGVPPSISLVQLTPDKNDS